MFSFFLFLPVASASQRDSPSSKDNNPGAYGSKQNALDLDAFKVGPYFDRAASKNVTALLGKTCYLNCRIKNLTNKTVSALHIQCNFGNSFRMLLLSPTNGLMIMIMIMIITIIIQRFLEIIFGCKKFNVESLFPWWKGLNENALMEVGREGYWFFYKIEHIFRPEIVKKKSEKLSRMSKYAINVEMRRDGSKNGAKNANLLRTLQFHFVRKSNALDKINYNFFERRTTHSPLSCETIQRPEVDWIL